jgi:hypothetical protein
MSFRANSPALRVEQLEDRLTPAGSVIPAGEFNWTQYSPTGELGQLLWNGGTLLYRSRVAGAWRETSVAETGGFTAAQYDSVDAVQKASQTAQLVFTSDGTPHALMLEKAWNGQLGRYQTLIHHHARTGAGWQKVETIAPPWTSQWGPNNLVAAAGPNNSIHFVFAETNVAATGPGSFGSGTLTYATNMNGAWGYAKIADTADLRQDVWFTGARWVPRFLSLAVGANGQAHVTYTPQFYIAGAFSTVQSTLMYATNPGGAWRSQTVMAPLDGTADAGLGASVAVNPTNGQVAIASYYVDRYTTGSPYTSQLLYHTLANGQWQRQTVTSTPDGYVAGDGAKFTGFAPQLFFDAQGRANIAFSDDAGEHLPVSYANQFAGQIRVATQSGSSWALKTMFRQTDPVRNQVLFPVAVVRNGQLTVAGLTGTSVLDANKNPTRTDFAISDVNAPSGLAAPVTVSPPPPPPPVVNSPPVVVSPPPPPPPPPVVVSPPVAVSPPAARTTAPTGYAVALDGNRYESQVRVSGPQGTVTVTPFYGYAGGVRFARADFNGDGVADIVTVPRGGIEARVRVWDGTSGRMLADFAPAPGFTGGLNVAAGDINGDRVADIVITPENGPPLVAVFDGRSLTPMAVFTPYGDLPYSGGLSLGVGDINRDGFSEVVVAPSTAAVSLVSTFDGRALSGGVARRLNPDFLLWDAQFQFGVQLAVGDLNGDGYADIAGGPTAGPAFVRAVSGRELSATGALAYVADGFLWGGTNNGVRLAITDADGDGVADLLASSGRAVARYAAPQLPSGTTGATQMLSSLYGVDSGIFVG